MYAILVFLNVIESETKLTEFANRVDFDEVAHYDLNCLPSII